MFVCRNGHDFEELPSMTISSCWRMAEATKLYRQLEDGTASIDAVTSSIKLKHAVRSSLPTVNTESDVIDTKVELPSKARVAYVLLRRGESGNVVVMSSEEKYTMAKSVFEPILNHLQSLSSADFYKALEK
ncbi:hypothetical protein GQ600_19344 [Phytophthora cactorum]|nr:hypothetical protein GQ600_19344 [Phytophthora cactorum]